MNEVDATFSTGNMVIGVLAAIGVVVLIILFIYVVRMVLRDNE